MLNIVEYSDKQDIPENPYQKKKPTLQEYIRTLNDETTIYDFDDYGIKSLNYIPFSQKSE